MLAEAEAVYAEAAAIVRKALGTAFLGLAASPAKAAKLAELDGDGRLSRFELMHGLVGLFGEQHWSPELPALLWKETA